MAGRRSASREGRKPRAKRARGIEGTVRELLRGGDALVDTDEGAVLAPGAFPGERVALAGVERRGGAFRARVARVLVPSSERVEPPCPLVDRCGGCPWMPLALASQRATKARFVSEAAGVAAVLEPSTEDLGYRRRARLAFARGRVGYRARRSRDVVDVSECAVLSPPLALALEAIRSELAPILEGQGEIALASRDGSAVVAIRSDAPQPPAVYDAARRLAERDGIAGLSIRAGGATVDARFGDPRERSIALDGEPMWGTVAGFSQAQDAMNRALVDRVVELAEPLGARVLELYAGHGNLTIPLAREAAELVAVEQDPDAAAACRENLAHRGLRARVLAADVAATDLGKALPRPDVVVLDPPRAGAREVLGAIVALRPARIIYVSCDTATLARDLVELRHARYTPDRAHAFDMFPHTAHVESLIRLS